MVFFLQKNNTAFPDPESADADGLLAAGGDLSSDRLIAAYTAGIFPWYTMDGIPFWYSPDPRFVLFPDKLRISKSMQQLIKRNAFQVTFNKCFQRVIHACAQAERKDDAGTWITEDFIAAYIQMHSLGFAHSVEVWDNGELAGGLYGIVIGKIFAGESMFALKSNASKYGLIALVKKLQLQGAPVIDCQYYSSHLEKMGAENIPRKTFLEILKNNDPLTQLML